MQKKTKIRLVISIILAGVLLLSGGAVGYFVIKSRRHVRLFRQAVKAYDDKDYKRARALFIQILRDDKNNETATVKLAEIAEIDGNWLNASYYRGQACKLNELEPSYDEAYLKVIRKGRYSGLILNYLKGLKRELTLDEKAMSLYHQLLLGQNDNAIPEWQRLQQEKPEILQTPYGKLVKTTYFSRQETIGNVLQSLEDLAASDDKVIAQEALTARASLERMFNRPEEEEKALKTAAELNYFTLAPKLGDFYSHYGRFDDAIELMVPYVKKFYNSSIILYIGEFMLLANKAERLDELLECTKQHRDRKSMLAGYYLESLKAFHAQNFALVAEKLHVTQSDIKTPLSCLMALVADTAKNDTEKLIIDYAAFQKIPRFRDFPERGNALVLFYIDERLAAGDSMDSLLGLVKLAIQDKAGTSNANLASIDLIAKIQKGTLMEDDLQERLKNYENASGVLMAAVSFYYFKGNYTQALKYYDKLKSLNEPISLFTQQQAVDCYIRLQRFNEASNMFKQLLLEKPTKDNLRSFWRYVTIHNDKDGMQFLADLPEKLQAMPVPAPAPKIAAKENAQPDSKDATAQQPQAAEPVSEQQQAAREAWQKQIENAKIYVAPCKAALLLIDGKTTEGLDALEKLENANDDILNFAAFQLAQGKRTENALALYRKISPEFSEHLIVLLNISNLLIELKRPDEALEVAHDAWKFEPTSISTIECYAQRLKERGDWNTVLEIVKPASFEPGKTDDIRAIWIWGVTESIKSNFEKGELSVAKSDAMLLQRFDHNNAAAQDYLTRITELQQKAETEKQKDNAQKQDGEQNK